jgi:alpha/beta superfamily hydrolase
MSRWVCFNHGKESGPWGSKIQRLAEVAQERGFQVMSPDYQGMDDVEQRIATLRQQLPRDSERLVLVGSSMGAYVAAAASMQRRPDGLFLLAPAVLMPGYDSDDLQPEAGLTLVIHGWHDEVVPVANAIRFCQSRGLSLLLLDSDHRLMSVLEQLCRQFALFLDALDGPCCN